MYQSLMYEIKRRILDETQQAFAEHPAFSDKIRVYNKFPYEERIQYGLILRNTSGSQIRLSPDNFMSDLHSLVRLSKEGTNPGIAIEWVRESAGNVTEVVTEDVSSQLGPTQRRFFTDHPILAGKDNTYYADNPGQVYLTIDGVKTLPESVDGEEREVLLKRAPSTGQIIEIQYYHRNIIAPSINIIDFTADNKFLVGNIFVINRELLVEKTDGTETTLQLDHSGGTITIDVNSDELYTGYVGIEDSRIYALERGTDYSVNYTTGVVTFLKPLESNFSIYANYRYQPGYSLGPFTFKPFQEVDDAIPGVIISIGRRAQMGDKQAITVTQDRERQAKIYGGHWEMSLELVAVSKDPSQMEQMTDHIISYLWGERKNVLEFEGITLNSVEPTGEAEEMHIDVTGDLYYESSVSINVQSEWQSFVPYSPIYDIRGPFLVAESSPLQMLKEPEPGFEKLT